MILYVALQEGLWTVSLPGRYGKKPPVRVLAEITDGKGV